MHERFSSPNKRNRPCRLNQENFKLEVESLLITWDASGRPTLKIRLRIPLFSSCSEKEFPWDVLPLLRDFIGFDYFWLAELVHVRLNTHWAIFAGSLCWVLSLGSILFEMHLCIYGCSSCHSFQSLCVTHGRRRLGTAFYRVLGGSSHRKAAPTFP